MRSLHERVSALGDLKTELAIGWTAASASGPFASMDATLSLYPLSAYETQHELDGR